MWTDHDLISSTTPWVGHVGSVVRTWLTSYPKRRGPAADNPSRSNHRAAAGAASTRGPGAGREPGRGHRCAPVGVQHAEQVRGRRADHAVLGGHEVGPVVVQTEQ